MHTASNNLVIYTLPLCVFQGEVLIYGSHSELVERGVDTKQLLGLIKEGDEKQRKDEFSYEDTDVGVPTEQQLKPEKCNLRLSLENSLPPPYPLPPPPPLPPRSLPPSPSIPTPFLFDPYPTFHYSIFLLSTCKYVYPPPPPNTHTQHMYILMHLF